MKNLSRHEFNKKKWLMILAISLMVSIPSLIMDDEARAGIIISSGVTLTSATLGSAGNTLTLVFSSSVTANNETGFSASFSTQGATTMTYASGTGTDTIIYNLNKTVNIETGTISYTRAGDGVYSGDSQLASIASSSVVVPSSRYREVFKARVTADSGTVVASDAVLDAAYQMLIDNSLYSSCAVWCSGRFAVKKDGSEHVSKIYDLSGNNRDGTGSTSIPVHWVSSSQNNVAGLSFSTDASYRSYISHSSFALSANSAIIVWSGNASNSNYCNIFLYGTFTGTAYTGNFISCRGGTGAGYPLELLVSKSDYSANNYVGTSRPTTNTTWHIYDYRISSDWGITGSYIDNTSLGSDTSPTITPATQPLFIGNAYSGATNSIGWIGNINEYLFFNSDITASTMSSVRSYMNGIWAVY